MVVHEMNGAFIVESGGIELLPRVETLWYELKEHHRKIDPSFPDMSTPSFELRLSGLKEKGKELLVDCVLRKSNGLDIGYCFSIIDRNDVGEIESLYIQEAFRGQGIGKDLVMRALLWMDQKCVTARRVSVLSGNREAIRFYEHFGFRSRVQELMLPTNKDQV
jgi:GNAT superfamily N-acetyltransferase